MLLHALSSPSHRPLIEPATTATTRFCAGTAAAVCVTAHSLQHPNVKLRQVVEQDDALLRGRWVHGGSMEMESSDAIRERQIICRGERLLTLRKRCLRFGRRLLQEVKSLLDGIRCFHCVRRAVLSLRHSAIAKIRLEHVRLRAWHIGKRVFRSAR